MAIIKQWTTQDEMFLRENFGKMSESSLAKILGCGVNKIRQKARKLGLRAKALENDISHERNKDKPSAPANKEERLFWGRLIIQGCQIKGCNKPGNIHHEPFKSQGGNHKSVVSLCKFHHQDGKNGRHAMSRESFNKKYNIDVLELAKKNKEDFYYEKD
jgi:hypothetical protein